MPKWADEDDWTWGKHEVDDWESVTPGPTPEPTQEPTPEPVPEPTPEPPPIDSDA